MSDAKSIDESLITPEIAIIARKKKKTGDEAALIRGLLERSLSAGAKTEMKSIAREYVYSFNQVIGGKFMDKGIIVEDQSIALYNEVFFTDHKKNTVRLSNDWITGECDIIVPGVKGIDIKSSWSLATFPAVSEDGEDSTYEWQCRGYMMLWDVPVWEVAYCMVNTPDELIKYEQEDLHFVDHIDEPLRVTVVRYERDLALEEKIKRKVDMARTYLARVIEQIKIQHNFTEAV
ncbi:hypothetical protein CR152_27705 [Massilia violaceinigra]|uniref:YqaJ viral recombinase domain-containing protein n=2 Tax=Massilia violaceinigra TaxID=2045208 RepID=A0A2D2DSB2_9BURK|nr:hypothetical protein CR152_27705 [Massilia violaceinigra]